MAGKNNRTHPTIPPGVDENDFSYDEMNQSRKMMQMPVPKMYVDTSAIGGVFDDESLAFGCKPFFDLVMKKKFQILVSNMTYQELSRAPGYVMALIDGLASDVRIFCTVTDEVKNLAQSYIDFGVLTEKSINDAIHVATATVYHADCIVSCNFRHMVNRTKIAQFNEVNRRQGYGMIDIKRPEEVIDYGDN